MTVDDRHDQEAVILRFGPVSGIEASVVYLWSSCWAYTLCYPPDRSTMSTSTPDYLDSSVDDREAAPYAVDGGERTDAAAPLEVDSAAYHHDEDGFSEPAYDHERGNEDYPTDYHQEEEFYDKDGYRGDDDGYLGGTYRDNPDEAEDDYLGGNHYRDDPNDDAYLGGHYDDINEGDGVFREQEPLKDGRKLKKQRGFRRRKRREPPTSEQPVRRRRWLAWCCAICCCLLLLLLLLALLLAAKFIWKDSNDDLFGGDGQGDDEDDGWSPYNPFRGITTTPFDPYVRDDCYFDDNYQPHVIAQCQCYNEVKVVANDTMELYWKVRDEVDTEIYGGHYDQDPYSCAPSNQALIWLSSGDMRDGGDLYQRYLLALMFIQTNGTSWDQLNLWMEDQSECLWFGSQCNGNFRLNNLALDMNNVMGSLPTELKHLEAVKAFLVTRNHLTGTIPPEIFEMPRLESLMLYANELRGSIPQQVERASNLRTLRLENNLFFGRLVSEIGQASNLEEFSVGFNEFWRTIPTELTKLTKMKWLVLDDNRFSGTMHTEFGYLTNLEYFLMTATLMRGSVPSELAALTNLQEMRLAHSGLSGTLPTEFAALTKLHRLELGYNNFEGTLMTEFGQMTGLNWLALNNNDFEGPLPTEFGNLENITRLLLDSNRLTGDIPSEFGRITKLSNFMIDNNDLSGRTPQQVCDLRDQMLDVFVADCPIGGVGLECPQPSCCSFCRQAGKFPNEHDDPDNGAYANP